MAPRDPFQNVFERTLSLPIWGDDTKVILLSRSQERLRNDLWKSCLGSFSAERSIQRRFPNLDTSGRFANRQSLGN